MDGSVLGDAPDAPDAPALEAWSTTALWVSWSAPADLGSASAITDYDLRYFAGAADPADEADWIEEGEAGAAPDPGAATGALISGLTSGQAYRVQVRAMGDGESPWSDSASGTPMTPPPALVSNFAVNAVQIAHAFGVDRATSFTTGGNAGGYRLTRVELWMKSTSATAPSYTLSIQGDSGSAPDGAALGTLTQVGSLPEALGTVGFAATGGGIDLEPGTTYWVVIDVGTSDSNTFVTGRTSFEEDPGSAAGWSIGNGHHFRNVNDSGGWQTNSSAYTFALAVRGEAKPATLVSNAAQTDGGPGSLANDHAQGFTTGGNAAGYSLTGVDLKLALTTGTAPTFTVKIHEDHPDGLGTPHDAVGTLTRQGDLSATAAPVRFAAPEGGLDLDPNTRYFVVLDITAGATGDATIERVGSDDEDSGGADGWSIENLRLFKLQSQTSWTQENNNAHRRLELTVHGFTKPLDPDNPTITIAAGHAVTEGAAAEFTVTSQPAPNADVTVNLTVSESGDFVAAGNEGSKTVTIPAGAESALYRVATEDDITDETQGTVTVEAGGGTGYAVGSPDSAEVTVDDDDAAAASLVSNTGQTVAEPGSLGTSRAQPFTTGGHADGYTLTRVDIRTGTGSDPWGRP